MSARNTAQLIAAILWLSTFGHAKADPPKLSGIELPDQLTFDGVQDVGTAISSSNCRSNHCEAWAEVNETFYWFELSLHHKGTNVWLGPPKDEFPSQYRDASREIGRVLAPAKTRYQAICDDLVAIAARDPQEDMWYNRLAAMTFEIARRVSTPKRDCFNEVLRQIPPGNYRAGALDVAHTFCIADHTQDCRRLKTK